ncbi:MAG: DUF2341 domain-containing protein, partial [Patescibacteria group bacterium]
MKFKNLNLKQILFYFYEEGRILLSKFLKEFRFFYLIYIKRDKSCKKIYSNWYVKEIPAQSWSQPKADRSRIGASGGKISSLKIFRKNLSGQKKEKTNQIKEKVSNGINWKEKYFDLQKQFSILEKKFRQQCFKFGTTRAVAVFLCIALIITAGWQMIWNMSRAAGAATWNFSNATDYTAATNVEVDAADNNIARLKQNYTPGTNWITTDGSDYDWNYRHEVTIDNSSLEYDFSNYQLKLTLNSDNFDFSIPDSSGSDIRFTGALARTNYATETERLNAQGTNEISYYKESYDQSAKTAVFWVKNPSIYSFWGVATENSGTDTKLKVDDVSGFPDPADFPNGEMPVTVRDTSNSEINYITAIDIDTKELTFKNSFSVSFLTALTAQVRYIEDEQIYLYYGNSNATVTTSSQGNTFTTTDTPEANLVGYWKFNDGPGATVHDYSGEGNTGTVTSGLSLTAGPVGPAMSFYSNKNVSIPSSSELSPTDAVSVEFWIYPTGRYSDWGWILGKTRASYSLNWEGWNARMRWAVANCGGIEWAGEGVPYLSYNTWTHVVATYDKTLPSNQKNVYYNGVLGESQTCTNDIPVVADAFTMSIDSSIPSTKQGGLDEVRVYSKALSQEEITAHYNLGRAISPSLTIQLSPSSLYSSIWQYQRAITIDNAGGGSLTNHQVKVSLTSLNFDFTHANSNGMDIRFADEDAATELNYWIESYTVSSLTGTLWVKVPSISADSTKTIYMYYGNTGAGVDQGISNASKRVINGSSLIASWHFDETTGVTAADSSGHGSTGTLTNGPTWAAGKFGNGVSFSASNHYVNIPTSDINYLAGSISVWVKPNWNGNDNTEHAIFTNRNGGTGSWVGLYKDTDNYMKVSPGGSTAKVNVSSWTAGTWHFVTFTWNNSTGSKIYVDGAAAVSYNGALGLGVLNANIQQYIGLVVEYTNYPFDGVIDEMNLFNTALTSDEVTDLYNSYGKTLSTNLGKVFIGSFDTALPTATVGSEASAAWPSSEVDKLTVSNNGGQYYVDLTSFAETLTGDNAGSVKYQISNNGTDWYWYNSGSTDWEAASGLIQTNTAADINTNIPTFDDDIHPGEIGTFYFKSFFVSDGTQKVELDSVAIEYIYDTLPPTDPVAATGYSDSSKATPIITNSWYAHTKPYFEFSAATDQANTEAGEQATGVAGYWVYFGTTSTADPEVSGTWINGDTDLLRVFESPTLTTTGTYYFRLKSKDNANNKSASSTIFTYKFDTTMPVTPTFIAVSPQGYASTDSFTFVWQEATDANSGFNGYCYKTGVTAEQNATLYSNFHSDSRCNNDGKFITNTSITTVTDPDLIHYQNGSNIFYITAKDNAGNFSYPATALYYFSGSAPGPIQNLSVNNVSSTTNSFTFTWDPPASYTGNIDGYYYSINQEPSVSNSVWLGNATSTGAITAATMQGTNTFYVVAKDDASNIDWDSWDPQGKVEFSCATPGLSSPTQVRLTDASIEYDDIYTLTLTWNPITLDDATSTFASYDIYRSTNGDDFIRRASLSDINQDYFSDTNLDPDTTYWYYIISVDNAAKESPPSYSDPTSYQPASEDDTAPILTGGTPVVTSHEGYASFTWSTDEPSDSHVEYGTSSGVYTAIQGNDTQTSSHVVNVYGLNSLSTYYYRIHSKDAAGNPLISSEYSFTYWPPEVDTSPEISGEQTQSPSTVGTEATITWTTDKYATSQVYYGTVHASTCATLSTHTTEDTVLNKSHMVQLRDLPYETTYYYCTRSKDTYDHITWGTMNTFTTEAEPTPDDITAPVISEINSYPTETLCTIIWTTDDSASSQIEYGSTTAYGTSTTLNSTLTVEHAVRLTGLTTEQVYHYRIKSKNIADLETISQDYTFTPQYVSQEVRVISTGGGSSAVLTDTTAPVISNVLTSNITENSATISWATNENANSLIDYGLTSTYTDTQHGGLSSFVTSHQTILSNLTKNTVYHYQVLSQDASGNLAQSADATFTTLSAPGETTP